MDGTIIDSTNAIVKFWTEVGTEIGVDPVTILATSHGRRSIDTLAILAPHLANWDCEYTNGGARRPYPFLQHFALHRQI